MKRIFAALVLILGATAGWPQEMAPPPSSRVYYAMDKTAVGPTRRIQAGVVRRMVDSLVCAVTAQPTPKAAWQSLVSPEDKVGIKVASSGGGVSGTHPAVVQAIVDGLIEAGIPAGRIVVWDRNKDDLLAAGYSSSGASYLLRAIDPKQGYDPEALVSAPLIGRLIWGDSKFGDRKSTRLADFLQSGEQLSSQSYYARVLSQEVTKVINVPSLMDSFSTGINGALVNMTLTNLDNWRRFSQSASEGDSYIAEVYADPMIRDKVVLTILDALIMQYAGGPFPNPNFTLENHSLFASRDPVAIDGTAFRLIEETRLANKMPSIKPMTVYLQAAVELGLGQFTESRIELVRVGVEGIR